MTIKSKGKKGILNTKVKIQELKPQQSNCMYLELLKVGPTTDSINIVLVMYFKQ